MNTATKRNIAYLKHLHELHESYRKKNNKTVFDSRSNIILITMLPNIYIY